jgi:hypothetical protein
MKGGIFLKTFKTSKEWLMVNSVLKFILPLANYCKPLSNLFKETETELIKMTKQTNRLLKYKKSLTQSKN